jgi:hypothetical protein
MATWLDHKARYMYMFGGRTKQGHQNSLWRFHVDDLIWEKILVPEDADNPVPITDVASESLYTEDGDFVLFIYGGVDQSGSAGTLYSYSTKHNKWKKYPNGEPGCHRFV